MTTSPPSFDRIHSDREALSALFDGELVGDAARFALKRLDHDHDWRETCERWTVVGDVLRGQSSMLLPAGFPSRVRAAMAADATPRGTVAARPRWAAWSGVGLAASAAAVALFFAGQNDPQTLSAQPAVVAAASGTAPSRPAPSRPVDVPATPTRPSDASQGMAQLATAGAVVAEASRQAAQRSRDAERNRSAVARIPQRRAVAAATTADRPAVETQVETAVAVSAPVLSPTDPFAGDAVHRPWPRAVLPQYGSSGALTTDVGTRASPSFYPFEPRLPGEESGDEASASAPTAP